MSIFISYRRDGGKPIAEEIYSTLCKEYDVFLDTQSLKNGYFDTAIISEIKRCSDFIILITETIFNRCSEPNDWIFHEAQIALRERKNIIPVFIGLKSFPDNVPDSIKEICRFNGVFWLDKEVSCQKIKSFLISNRKCILSVVQIENRVGLSTTSKEELKELYRRFLKNGRQPTEIQVRIQDVKDLSTLLLRKDIVGGHGIEAAEHFAQQSLLKKEKWIHDTLEFSIECMLQDEMIDTCSLKLKDIYIAKYGVSDCVFLDEDGVEAYYWTPFFWIDIIEELLKELLIDRYYVYGNSKVFTEIDCFVETRGGDEIWSFSSFIPKLPDNQEYIHFMDKVEMPGGRADYMDIPIQSLAFHVYPDLYYNIGLLKTNKTMRLFDEVNKYKDVFNLWHYYFGLH